MFIIESFAALFIWLISMIGGLFALQMTKRHSHNHVLQIAEAFAGGIFLGAALFHMLPDAEQTLRNIYPELNYPLANLICAISFCIFLFLEQIMQYFSNHNDSHSVNLLPMLLTALISIHALSEGIALGINQDVASILLIFIAIAVHKSSEGFAVAIQLLKSRLKFKHIVLLFTLFSFMSPLGISLGFSAHYFVHGKQNQLLFAIFNAFAAGSFLYIATLHKLHHKHNHQTPLKEFIATLFGLTIMASVAIWL